MIHPFLRRTLLCCLFVVCAAGSAHAQSRQTATDSSLDYCYRQVLETTVLKRTQQKKAINPAAPATDKVNAAREAAFRAGILWYAYEYKKDNKLLKMAESASAAATNAACLGQETPCPDYLLYGLGTANHILADSPYQAVLTEAAASLASFYDSLGGVIGSPVYRAQGCYTAAADLPGIELLFRVANSTGMTSYRVMALKHTLAFLSGHIRKDHTVYPLLACGINSPAAKQQLSGSMFDAGSQAGATYGLTMIFWETRLPDILAAAEQTADAYVRRFPGGSLPLTAAGLQDVTAAAVMSAALIELSGLATDVNRKRIYIAQAKNTLKTLAARVSQGGPAASLILLSAGDDAASGYAADYYYLQALLWLKRLEEGKRIYDPL